jgi:hypothetical protein
MVMETVVNNVYTIRPGRQSKAEIVNLRPWSVDPVIEALRDPWIYREAEDALAEVADAYPDLGLYGWQQGPPLEAEASRPSSVEEFAVAKEWLGRLVRSKPPATNSYFLKHVLEYESSPQFYTANGIFIAAAISLGIAQRRSGDGPNSLLGIRLPKADRRNRS